MNMLVLRVDYANVIQFAQYNYNYITHEKQRHSRIVFIAIQYCYSPRHTHTSCVTLSSLLSAACALTQASPQCNAI